MNKKRLIFPFFVISAILFCILTLKVTAFAKDLPSVTTNYQMKAGETTSTRLSVENTDTKNHTYSLKTTQLPKDFNGYFTLDGKVVDSIDIPTSQKSMIEFCIDTPINSTITEVSVSLQILREDGVNEIIYVSYYLNEAYALEISSNVQSFNAVNGNSIRLEIGVVNTGSKELTDLKLQVEPPYKWILEKVEPMSLRLKPNGTGVFVVNVTIPSSGQAGQYPVKATCSNAEIKSNVVTVPVNVSTSTNYFWWVAGGIVILLIFTIMFFKKHGRR